MNKIVLLLSALLLAACAHHGDTGQRLPHSLKANLYRTNAQMAQGVKIDYGQLTAVERQVVDFAQDYFLRSWVRCDGRDYMASIVAPSMRTPYYEGMFVDNLHVFEIAQYRSEINLYTAVLTAHDLSQNRQWRGHVVVKIHDALGRDIIANQPYYFLSERPQQSLPSFAWTQTQTDMTLIQERFYLQEGEAISEEVLPARRLTCATINQLLKATQRAKAAAQG